MPKAIGIDLGTTNSVVAYMDGGEAKVISNAEGNRTTPSVVAFRDGERLVGELAKRQAVTNPKGTVMSIKREMGTAHSVSIDGKSYSPQEISAMVLQKLKADAEAFLGEEVKQAVITCPAYFTDAQRQATKDAGRIAGLEVLRIINEPTAAALSYQSDRASDERIMVFDLGGGTFDVSVLEIYEVDGMPQIEVKATAGNNRLGGDDIDHIVMDWIISEFQKKEGTDLSKDVQARQRIREAAEKAKMELSGTLTTQISLPFIANTDSGPLNLDLTLSRAEFERMIAPLVEKTMTPARQALKDAGIKASDLDRVLLVGGSTRIPAVQRAVNDLTGKEPSRSVNPDEAVALGAALQAGILTGESSEVLLLDVTPLTLGIETKGGITTTMIERNTTIPTSFKDVFSTAAANQPQVDIHILQGERDFARNNTTLARFVLDGIPPAPAGTPQIEVMFDIDSNGILKVSAKDRGTGKAQEVKITASHSLSPKEVEQKIAEAEKHAEEDRARKELVQVRNEADSLRYGIERLLEEQAEKISGDLGGRIRSRMTELEQACEGDSVEAIRAAMKALEQVSHELAQSIYDPSDANAGHDGAGASGGDDVVDADYTVNP